MYCIVVTSTIVDVDDAAPTWVCPEVDLWLVKDQLKLDLRIMA